MEGRNIQIQNEGGENPKGEKNKDYMEKRVLLATDEEKDEFRLPDDTKKIVLTGIYDGNAMTLKIFEYKDNKGREAKEYVLYWGDEQDTFFSQKTLSQMAEDFEKLVSES